ncbi:hypothetical protein O181_086633 [Austropuccinia psidii MF-1]|uniref:Uncharacterized protein n=1 Tax=Austropuccinia psidii MF-1 TaxID=1389203 RepID=A0A9Q3FVE0_9BASI|nr:hypothetical protein [Austropuccinia psidii MF-1]
MFSFSILHLCIAFFLSPTVVVLKKSSEGIALPDDPNATVKVYRTTKMDLTAKHQGKWIWTLDGNSDLQIETGYDREVWFGAYVNTPMNGRTISVKIRSGLMDCRSSQTYFANVTHASRGLIEQFNFKINTRGAFADHWHFLKGKSLKSSYVWGRGGRSLSGDIIKERNGTEVAHIHCNSTSSYVIF